MVFQQLPTAGVPHQFDHWGAYESYLDDMQRTGVINSIDEIRSDIRPAPRWGTIEVRVCDASSNLREVLAMAALTQTLVEYFSTMLDQGQKLPQLPAWFIDENKWRSARYGMDAELIIDAAGTEEAVATSVERALHVLEPTAKRLGCAEQLSWVNDILTDGAGYQRQRTVAARHDGSLEAVASYLVAEMKADRPIPPNTFTFTRS
ncbi:MAG: glutamate-cysteine ligase family protein, partial [Bowdeniella nasicola]|nr:glutamate-cysteine ligase family protein [Bowdeniella nasicola]